MKSKFLILLTAGALLCAATATPSAAHPYRGPRCRIVSSGLVIKLSQYQQPDGTYNSLADFIRDVNGTPCGVDCDAPSRVIFATPPTYYCSGY